MIDARNNPQDLPVLEIEDALELIGASLALHEPAGNTWDVGKHRVQTRVLLEGVVTFIQKLRAERDQLLIDIQELQAKR